MRSWKFWLGRSLIVACLVLLGLLLMFLAWIMGNALVGSYDSPKPGARLWFGVGLVLVIGAGFIYRQNVKSVLMVLVALSLIGLGSYAISDNLIYDLAVFGLAYPVIWFGYWLSGR